jgi:hypothetical protein
MAAASWSSFICVSSFLVIATAAYAQSTVVDGGRGVSARVEVDRAIYQAGQPISIRLTLTNTSGHSFCWLATGPAGLVDVQIYDADGRKIEPTLPSAGHMGSGPMRTWMTGDEVHLTTGDDGGWIGVSLWGYDVRSPGKYRVVVIPIVGDPNIAPSRTSQVSNDGILITIAP